MEPITVFRGEPTTDTDGNARIGTPVAFKSFMALVSEEQLAEPRDADSEAVLIGCELYIRDQGPTGIRSTDLVEVRGERLPVDGKPVVWRRASGDHIGDVVALRRKDG